MDNSCVVVLKCISNLHVGNGDVNYNIIDNEIERDTVTGYPTINSSGVKGALRSFISDENLKKELFGADDTKQKGKLKIMSAELVAMPQRATAGDAAYYLISTDTAIKRCNDLSKMLIDKELIASASEASNISAEGRKLKQAYSVSNETIYTVDAKESEDIFVVPVIARNHLDNGESKNLWYEEIVPHESIFMFGVIAEDEKCLEKFINAFSNNKVVQFGGNATIGCGLCKLSILQ